MSWVFSSLHTPVGLAFVGAVVGEYLGSARGVGYLILQAEGTFDINTVFAGILVLTALRAGARLASSTLVERRLMNWQPRAGETEKVQPGYLTEVRCIGARDLRKLFCNNDFSPPKEVPRCRQSVARTCSDLHPSKAAGGGGVRWRRMTSDAGGAAAGRDRPGDRADRAVRGLLRRSARPGAGRARGGDAGRPAGVRHRAGLRGPDRPRPAAPRPGAGGAGRQARGAALGLCAAGGQEHAEPAGAGPARSRRATTRSATTRRRSSGCSSICSSTRMRRRPSEIILDLDATDDPLHGHQEGRFFHGYYDCYCYLPLYVFCGRHLLAAKLRRLEHRRLGRRGRGGGADRRARSAAAGRRCGSCCAPIPASPARR